MDLSSKFLHVGVMLTIVKVFISLFLPCLWEKETPWQFSRRERSFLEGPIRGQIVRLPQRALCCHER